MISYKLFIILNIIFLKLYFAFIVENRVEMTGSEVGEREREEVLEPGFELRTPVSLTFLTNINHYFF